MSIRHMLFGIISIFACLTAIFSGVSVKNAYEEKQRFEFAQDVSQTIRYLLIAGGHWAVERGITNSSIQNKNIVPSAFANKFKERRRLGNEAYGKAVESFKSHNLSHLRPLFLEAEAAHAEAQSYRALADSNYSRPKDQRNNDLLKNWVPIMGKQILKTQDLRFALTKEISEANPELGRQAQLKHFSWLMSEYAGRERAVIGGILAAEAKISSEKLKTLSEFRGRVLAGWDTVQKLITNSNDKVQNTLAPTKNVFFGSFQQLREKIYANGVVGKPYQTKAPFWIKTSTNAIDTLLATQQASSDETDAYIQDHLEAVNNNLYISLTVLCATLMVMIGSCYVVIMHISRPLGDIHNALNMLTSNSEAFEAVKILHTERSNEIGALARGIQRFQTSLIEQDESRRREEEYIQKQAQSEKDRRDAEEEMSRVTKLQHEKEVQRSQDMDKLIKSFSMNIGQFMSAVQNSVHGLQDSSSSLAALSEETGAGAETLSAQTKSMTNIIKEISSSTDNLIGSFSQVEGAVNNTETMISQVTEFTEKADEMTENFTIASRKVTNAVNLISSIANQINLLALNAGIESARAGEAGKGFAVVASEVKALASETGDSVQEIDHVIQSMCEVSGDMANTLRQIGGAMASVRNAASQIEEAVGEQRTSSGQIFESIKHSSEVSTSVSNASVELSQGANESSNVSCSVNEVSDQISHKSRELQQFIDRFLNDIKEIQESKVA